jgi:hypothetical protein
MPDDDAYARKYEHKDVNIKMISCTSAANPFLGVCNSTQFFKDEALHHVGSVSVHRVGKHARREVGVGERG